jgi:hypothetical protein
MRVILLLTTSIVAVVASTSCSWENCETCCYTGPARAYFEAVEGDVLTVSDIADRITDDPPTVIMTVTNLETDEALVGRFELVGSVADGFTLADEGPNIIEGSEEMAEEDRCGFDTRIVIELDVPESWNAGDATFAEKTIEGEAGHETSFYGLLWDRWPVRFGWSEWIT